MRPEDVLDSLEKSAPERGWPIIGPKRGRLLDEAVLGCKPTIALEVGTNVGYSAIRIGRLLRVGQRLVCVEIRQDMANAARENLAKAGLSDRVEVKVGDAREVLPALAMELDFVFLDAVKADYLVYLKSIEGRMHKGTVVFADNVKSFAGEVAPYLDYVRNSGRYQSSYREAPSNYGTDEGDAVEVSVRL